MNKYEFKGKTYLATSQDNKINDIAAKHGIELPSEDLAIFVTKYAALEDANLNGVRLSSDAVNKFLPSINGKLADVDHIRPYVIGSILDGWVNADTKEIEIAFTMYKSVFVDEYAQALEKLNEGTLSVSFELTTNPDTVEAMTDGTIRLHDINFSGVGLLLNTNPAYPKAKVYEMANRLLNKVKDSNMVFASQIAEELGSNIIAAIEEIKQEGGQSVMELTEEQKLKITEIKNQLGDNPYVKEFKDEDFLNEAKLIEAGYTVEKVETSVDTVVVDDTSNTTTITENEKVVTTTTDDNGTQSVDIEEKSRVCTYTQEQVDQMVQPYATTASDLQAENDLLKSRVKELEDSIIAKEEAIKTAEKVNTIKAELGDNPYVKEFKDEDFLNEDKVEKAKILKERDDAKAELAALKKSQTTQEVVASEEVKLVTGHEEVKLEKTEKVCNLINKLGKD